MGYYIRVLGTSNPNIHIDELERALSRSGLTAKFEIDPTETKDNWTTVEVSNFAGNCLIQIERNHVVDGALGKEELEEFREDIKYYKPNSAVKWLLNYFNNVKVVYAFQILHETKSEDDWKIIDSVRARILANTGGITQADSEGFSNESGFHILWQFSDDVEGEYDMAVKNFFGNWTNFRMDLGDLKQREEFWKGKVPRGAKKL
ncbi:MAG: hypothetical protein ACKVOK_11260 [Flavobacteriales bacterium]